MPMKYTSMPLLMRLVRVMLKSMEMGSGYCPPRMSKGLTGSYHAGDGGCVFMLISVAAASSMSFSDGGLPSGVLGMKHDSSSSRMVLKGALPYLVSSML